MAKIIQITSVAGGAPNGGIIVYGLDDTGKVWYKNQQSGDQWREYIQPLPQN